MRNRPMETKYIQSINIVKVRPDVRKEGRREYKAK